MNFSIYQIITFFSYVVSFCVLMFYGYKLKETSNPVHTGTKNIYTGVLLSAIYVPFIGCLISIFDRGKGEKYQYYIILNILLIILIITPLILFKDKILLLNYLTPSYSRDDLIDSVEYDNEGNKVVIDKNDPKYKIRQAAASSEINNRYNINQGLSE